MLTLHISALDRLRSLIGIHPQSDTTVNVKARAEKKSAALAQSQTEQKLKPLPQLVSDEDRRTARLIVQELAAQLPYALAVAVLHAKADLPLAHAGIHRDVSPASLAVQFGRIARQASEMAATLVPEEGSVQELICASEGSVYMLTPIGELNWWLFLAIETKDTNMAIARSMMQSTIDAFKDTGRKTTDADADAASAPASAS